ncbi:class 1 fructose-bisphosphatase [Derxia gummosa]|uniref:Fructose-1,6-bisphosphatase class 1 n=1 Tax=Derxia gummosa DSM 723 TaxID=1121388 RepID=A0A8B6X595_9BURK|nr:class 1 fructose-bisphosphatase [Derxia gummosa]
MSDELKDWLDRHGGDSAITDTMLALAGGCRLIADAARRGPLIGLVGSAGSSNVQGEVQQQLDVYTNDLLCDALEACRSVAGYASEEMEDAITSARWSSDGVHLVLFDPLDGSSNIEANISVGTIFSVLPHPEPGRAPEADDFLQPGRHQLAAGYAVYGPATSLVVAVAGRTAVFTLEPASDAWVLTRDAVRVPVTAREFAINASNERFWEAPVQRYVAECVAGADGPRSRDFNMRWVASLVAETHRILSRGGVFLYPRDGKEPRKPGRLRLMYEANPVAFVMAQAGACAVTGSHAILDVRPEGLHQRVPLIFGSADEVGRIVEYHADTSANVSLQLFKTRSLFVNAHA